MTTLRIVADRSYRLHGLTLRDDLLVAVLHGTKTLHAGVRQCPVPSGSVVLVARGTRWDIENDPAGAGHYEALQVPFSDELVREVAALPVRDGSTVRDVARFELDPELHEAILRTLPGWRGGQVSLRVQQHRQMEVLLLLAERGWRLALPVSADPVAQLRRMVSRSPDSDWSVARLAGQFHMSESTLRRRLESEGTSVAALVREVRLEHALLLLQSTRLPVAVVAERCGWTSPSRFTAAFRARWNVPPSVVRVADAPLEGPAVALGGTAPEPSARA